MFRNQPIKITTRFSGSVTSLDGITGRSIQTLLRGENDSKQLDEFQASALSTRTRPTSTYIGWRVKENFPETFKSQLKKNKNVVHWPRSVRIGRKNTLGLSTARGRTQDLGHSFSQYGPSSRWPE